MNTKKTYKIVKLTAPGQKNSIKKFSKTGRYHGYTPYQAAKKAFSSECDSHNIRGQCTFRITLKDVTRGGSEKEYTYRLKRIKYSTPVVVNYPSGSVTYEYKVVSSSNTPSSSTGKLEKKESKKKYDIFSFFN